MISVFYQRILKLILWNFTDSLDFFFTNKLNDPISSRLVYTAPNGRINIVTILNLRLIQDHNNIN